MKEKQLSAVEYKSKLLPKYIELTNPNPGERRYMSLRKFMKAVDVHNYRGNEWQLSILTL